MIEENKIDIKMDAEALYREEVYTDRKMGSIRVMTPVKQDGSEDSDRSVLYVGQAQLMTPMGALPLAFEIEATSLTEAVDKYPEHAQQALDKTMEELKELRRQQASSIVVPGEGGMPPGGLPGGGTPGGGIQMP
ncbi:MAG: hypothetical protein PVF28_07895 [Thioalkalispiraceae bacterium]|jgi:hypothetical protein